MAETLAEVESQLEGFRHQGNRQAWLALRIRERCLKNVPSDAESPAPRLVREESGELGQLLGIEAYILARHFHGLAEPGRSALALFYLDLFTPVEIARLLKMHLEELGVTLAGARAALAASLGVGDEPANP